MSRRTVVAAVLTGCGALALAACAEQPQRQQSAFSPANDAAATVDGHWQLMLLLGSTIFLVVVVMMLAAVLRRRRRDADHDRARQAEQADGWARRGPVVVGLLGAVVPALVIVVVMAHSVLVLRDTASRGDDDATLVEVHAQQFWWDVRYPDHDVVTANEIHIPVGEEVRVEMTSDDVIHSLWVPQLGGKVDLLPGETTTMTLSADQAGVYWGQCAEYCGIQHAWMRLVVVAHDEAEFAGWVDAQARPAEPGPAVAGAEPDPEVAVGREVFMSSSCVYCHAIAGTEATGTLGPDLTHLATRQTIGAGVLPNDRESLARWIRDPQAIKPGNAMPGTDLSDADLDALLTYLESLE